MAAKKKESPEAAGKALVVLETLVPKTVFAEGGIDALLEQVKALAVIENTDGGKAEMEERRSLAYKIAQTKVAVDEMGKEYVAEIKVISNAVDARRKAWREKMEELQEQVRKPLTDFENAEKARVEKHQQNIQRMRQLSSFDYMPGVNEIEANLAEVHALQSLDYQEFAANAATVAETATGRLSERLAESIKAEEDAKKLRELTARNEELERQAWEKKIADDAAAKARDEAAAEAQKKIDDAKAETARIQREAEEAEQKRQRDEQKKADDAAKAKAQEEAEQKRRDEDKEHRAKINRQILAKMSELAGVTQEQAKAIITAIVNQQIPNTRITY